MRSWVIFAIFGLMMSVYCRPPRNDEGNESRMDETEYETGNDGPEADDSAQEDEDSSNVNEQDPTSENEEEEETADEQKLEDAGENADLRRAIEQTAKTAIENLSERPSRNVESQRRNPDSSMNAEYRSFQIHRAPERYLTNTETNDATEQPANIEQTVSDEKREKLILTDKNQDSKRTPDTRTATNEGGDFLFRNDKQQRDALTENIDNNNNGALDSSEQGRYFKQYYNTMQADNRDTIDSKNYINRDRRQVQNIDQIGLGLQKLPNEKDVDNNNAEDEESAIKRHVKKLSGDELEELLNSLSQEKRNLLKKIMETDSDNKDSINKREITKKAGAVEENNLESGQVDSSKLQFSSSSSLDISSSDTPTTIASEMEANKQAENKELPDNASSNKAQETTNGLTNSGVNSRADVANQGKSNSGVTTNPLVADGQSSIKSENKREANLDEFENAELNFDDLRGIDNEAFVSSDSQSFFCPHAADMSEEMDDESGLNSDTSNTYKREALLEPNADIAQSIKSLEESFPNSKSYDDSNLYSGSNMAPLVRVKRRNEDLTINKRSAALMPDAKVAYFPYKAENEDEDNDEGNEFDDGGFYDRTSSLTRNAPNLNTEESDKTNSNSQSNKVKLSQTVNLEKDSSIGSDTDSVFSGVEGIDDNLMFSSGFRNRRTAAESEPDAKSDENASQSKSTPLLANGMIQPSEYNISVPSYQESDAFGPLPRNYDGELSRYKRIRRVKEPNTSDDASDAS